jgi:hypothetical protein
MTGDGFGIVAGAPVHSHGRAFIPIVSCSVLTFERGTVISVVPLGIYVVDHRTEYYYPLTGDEPDFEAVERLAEILQQERERSVN